MGGMGGGKSTETSTPVFQTTPGAYGTTDYGKSTQLANQAQAGLNWQSPFANPLQDAILNPSYMPTTQADQNLLDSLMDLTAGRGAVRGLGSPTQSSLAATIAPQLLQMRQEQVQNLMGAKSLDQQQQAMTMQALLELVGLAMPQTVGGTQTTGTSKQYNPIAGLFHGW